MRSAWKVATLAVLAAVACLLFYTAPTAGDFQYSDAPRHALNGAFFLDFFQHPPIDAPVEWAVAYYLKYPALTVMFYPPLFHVVEAAMFALFGVSHSVAQATVLLFGFWGAVAAYDIARHLLSRGSSLAAAVLYLAIPVSAFWSRQVMLDVPATSVAMAGVAFVLRYTRTRWIGWLILGTLTLALSLYVKQTMAFIAIPVAWLLFRHKLLFQRSTFLIGGAAGLCLVPLAIMSIKYGGFNAVSVKEQADLPILSALFYIAAIPRQLGWLLTATGAVTIPLAFIWKKERLPAPFSEFLAIWLFVGLVFFTAIGLKSDRFDLPVLFPLILITLWSIERLLRAKRAISAAAILAAGTFVYSLLLEPVPSVAGYREAAAYVIGNAPRNATVLFSGQRDGSFIFNIRALAAARQDLSVVRSDKLFFEIAVSPRYGVKTLRDLDERQIGKMLDGLGVQVIVAQDDYLIDQPVMTRLQKVLDGGSYKRVRNIRTEAQVYNAEDKSISIYRRLGPPPPSADADADLNISLPIIGQSMDLRERKPIEVKTNCLFCF